MKNYHFKRGWAPLVGLAAGAYVAFDAVGNHPEWKNDPVWFTIYGGLGGALVGCFIFLIDPPNAQAGQTDQPIMRASVIARTLSILGLLLVILPPVGLPVSLVAVIMNSRTKGWPRVVSWIGLLISALLLTLIMLLVHFADRAAH